MIYCRFSEGDVYLIMHCDGGWICYLCELQPFGEFGRVHKCWSGDTLGEVRDHLRAHIDAGHEVPDRAIEMVLEEIEELGEEFDNPYDGFI